MRRERTPQQLDPLGTYSVWLLPAIVGGIAVVYAVAATIWHGDQISDRLLAALGLILVTAASVFFVWTSLPRYAPFTRARFVGMLALAVLGSLSFSAATWNHNRMIQDDWGQIVLALLLLASAQLRPTRDLIIGGIVVGGLLATAAAVQAAFLAVAVTPVVYGVVAATPPIALALGGAAYSRAVMNATERWQRRARAGMQELEPQVRASVARSVQQEFVTALNREAAPLVEHILHRGEITSADSDAAALVSRQLRGQAVGVYTSNWLDASMRRAGVSALSGASDAASAAELDPRLIEAVTADQRAVFGALLLALSGSTEWAVVALRVSVAPVAAPASGAPAGVPAGAPGGRVAAPAGRVSARAASRVSRPRARLTLVAHLATGASDRRARTALMPYLSVLRVIAHDARLRAHLNRIEVGFTYDVDE